MSDSGYPVDPMTAFYAAVTAVENGSIGEIDLDFHFSTHEEEVTMSMSIRRKARVFTTLRDVEQKEDDDEPM